MILNGVTYIKINDKFEDVLDENNGLICNIYGKNDRMLVPKGKTLTEDKKKSLSKQIIKISEGDYKTLSFDKKYTEDNSPEEKSRTKKPPKEQKSKEKTEKKLFNELEQKFGKQTAQKYKDIRDSLKEIFKKDELSDETIQKTEKMYDDAHTIEPDKLALCINHMRKANTRLVNHSLNIFFLFKQALEDLNKHIREPGYDIFYQNKINFGKNYKKNYCTGAVLHDFGKLLLPQKLIDSENLTTAEKKLMQTHPRKGVEALKKLGIDDFNVLHIVGDHHFLYRHYKNEAQSPLATICNILDTYDVFVFHNTSNDSLDYETALDHLKKHKIKNKWNPFIFDVLTTETLKEYQNIIRESAATGV